MTVGTLALSGVQHASLIAHLLPGDGLESAAILLCSTGNGGNSLHVRDVVRVPHGECRKRTAEALVWPGARLAESQAVAEDEGLAVILVHSHPGGTLRFSRVDDDSDRVVLGSMRDGWCGSETPVLGSAVMVPGGAMRARVYDASGRWSDLTQVRVAGDEVMHFRPDGQGPVPMAFGDAMTAELRRRRACVIGVSGTGSIVAEQLARMGIGGLVLVDFDRVEPRNLNRILNSTAADAVAGALKVETFARSIGAYRPDLDVVPIPASILSREAVEAAAGCDVVFSCVDSSEGRQIADMLCQAFLLPLVDMGVSIPTRRLADGSSAVADALGRIDFVQPGRSSLRTRGVFTPASLRAEYLARTAPEAHAGERDEGYVKGAPQEAPAVISLNMRAASAAVLEYVARSFPFRHEPNGDFARVLFRLAEGEEERFAEASFPVDSAGPLGIGGTEPLLGLPALGASC